MRTITTDAMWWILARRTMCLLAIDYTNCLRHAVLLSMSKPLTLKTAQGIRNILPHSKVEKSTTNMIRKRSLSNIRIGVVDGIKIPSTFQNILWTLSTPSGLKKDFKFPRIKKRSLGVWLHAYKGSRWDGLPPLPGGGYPLQRHIILVIWASVQPSKRRVPFLCLFMEWTSTICCWRLRVKWQALTLFNVLSSSIQDISRNLG